MAESNTYVHVIGSSCAWEDAWFALSLARKIMDKSDGAIILAPETSLAFKTAPEFGLEVEGCELGSAINPLEWRRLSKLAEKHAACAVMAHDRNSAAVLARSKLAQNVRGIAMLYQQRQAVKAGFLAKLDAVYAASRYSGGELVAGGGSRLLYAGVDLERLKTVQARRDAERQTLKEKFCPDKDKPLFILYAAPFVKQSRHRLLLEAMPDIIARLPQAHLLLPGEGEEFAELERQARITALENEVTFLDADHEILELMTAADLYVTPCLEDGSGVMAIAAMAAGRAVVAVKDGIYPEILENEKTGVLIEHSDAAALAEALYDILHNRTKREHLGRLAAAKAAKSHNLAIIADSICSVQQS